MSDTFRLVKGIRAYKGFRVVCVEESDDDFNLDMVFQAQVELNGIWYAVCQANNAQSCFDKVARITSHYNYEQLHTQYLDDITTGKSEEISETIETLHNVSLKHAIKQMRATIKLHPNAYLYPENSDYGNDIYIVHDVVKKLSVDEITLAFLKQLASRY